VKKIICIILAVVLSFGALSGCTKPNTQNNATIAATTAVTTAGTTTEAVTTSVDNQLTESNLPFAPYKSYIIEQSVEDALNDNPIDKSFLAEASKQITTVDNAEFIRKYIQIWNAELNYTLKNLRRTF